METYSFALENLEGRALFSVFAPTGMAPMAPDSPVIAAAPITIPHPLTGAFNVRGTYTHPISPGGPGGGNPDSGGQYDFIGNGKKATLGKFKLTGHVTTPGFIANAKASGRLVLTSARGTITLSLHGPPQTPGTLPPSFSYKIVKGTGIYTNSTGKGHIAVSASDSTHKFLFRFNPPT
jgi:hypothetical protein